MLLLPVISAINHLLKGDQIDHSRQTSRVNRATDVFNRNMDRSDPVILSYNIESRLKNREKKKHDVPAEVLALMKDPPTDNSDPILQQGYLEDILNDF